jgi:hypothetical protein
LLPLKWIKYKFANFHSGGCIPKPLKDNLHKVREVTLDNLPIQFYFHITHEAIKLLLNKGLEFGGISISQEIRPCVLGQEIGLLDYNLVAPLSVQFQAMKFLFHSSHLHMK